jgi:hypothetical protein
MSDMSRPKGMLDSTVKIVFLVLLAVLILFGAAIFVILVFVPVAGWYIWKLNDKNKELENRVATLEGHPTKDKDKS